MSKTQLDWKKFEPLFGSWSERIRPFFFEGGFDNIYSFLREQGQSGKQICPASMHTYRTFINTPLDELTMVIVCQEPYSKVVNGSPIASGVALDCSITSRNQLALDKFYQGIERELYNGLNLNYVNSHDLSFLSDQGVLLLNAAFTVEKDTPGSHVDIWKPFTEFLLKNIISSTGVPILFLGKQVADFSQLVENTNPCFTLTDPASVPAIGGEWNTNEVFTTLNRILWNSNKDVILFLPIDAPF